MRMWHYNLISVLPKQQLLAQWRECCCIAKNIATKGTPNHLLVNKVLQYPVSQFMWYCNEILIELNDRGCHISESAYRKLCDNISKAAPVFNNSHIEFAPYKDWHTERYLKQCYNNLEEKYDCGGISEDEWLKITTRYCD